MTPMVEGLRVAVFMTRGNSLASWRAAGILDRELGIYRALAARGWSFLIVTYGDEDDSRLVAGDDQIEVACNLRNLPPRLYELLVPVLHAGKLRDCHVIKTNQTNGADIALRSARFIGKPMVARCGYMWSDFAARQYGNESREAGIARKIEQRVFTSADRIIVTTAQMRGDVADRFGRSGSDIAVVPNYVDTSVFRPVSDSPEPDRIVFVGRLEPQKNVGTLLQAAKNLGLKITIVGEGTQEEELKTRYGDGIVRVEWTRRVPHGELPRILGRASVFALPSYYEGHPKSLLEAMACGMPVVGTNVPGIKDVIEDSVTGVLCEPDVQSLERALSRVLADRRVMEEMGKAARRYVLEKFSLERIALTEEQVLRYAACRGTTGRAAATDG